MAHSEKKKKRGREEEEERDNYKRSMKMNRGSWTVEEDTKLAQVIQIYGPQRWKSVASKAGLNRCGKSCRLRWMNYLRPNIKRGNISDQEEDLILRLHKLLGNRWSLIAGRLPGRTDNEIKNYWNSYLSKKIKEDHSVLIPKVNEATADHKTQNNIRDYKEESDMKFDADDFFDFSNENPSNLEWLRRFIQIK